jgi:hypothetical protein
MNVKKEKQYLILRLSDNQVYQYNRSEQQDRRLCISKTYVIK